MQRFLKLFSDIFLNYFNKCFKKLKSLINFAYVLMSYQFGKGSAVMTIFFGPRGMN